MTAEETKVATAMQLGSEALLKAIQDAGKIGYRNRYQRLLWAGTSQTWAAKEYPRAAEVMAQKDDVLSKVVSRDPCFRCGARGDLECGH